MRERQDSAASSSGFQETFNSFGDDCRANVRSFQKQRVLCVFEFHVLAVRPRRHPLLDCTLVDDFVTVSVEGDTGKVW